MEKDDIARAVGHCSLDDLHLALSLDHMLMFKMDAKGLAVCAIPYKSPEMNVLVSLGGVYHPHSVLGLLICALADGLEHEKLVDCLFQSVDGQTGQMQAELLFTGYALFMASYRLECIGDLSENKFALLLEQGSFTDDAFQWFYILHSGMMALKHRVDVEPNRVGRTLNAWFDTELNGKDLMESLAVIQAFAHRFGDVFMSRAKSDERFKMVLEHLSGLESQSYLDVEFDDKVGRVLKLYK